MGLNSNYSAIERFRHVLLSTAAGLILAAALTKPGTWIAAWIGLVPLLLAVKRIGYKQACLCGWITGAVYYGIVLYWIGLFGYLPWALLVAYQALYFAAFAALYARIGPERIGPLGYAAAPAAWVALQFVRTLGVYAFIWGSFAHTQVANLPVAQIASVTGPWGIDFLVCLVNVALATSLHSRPVKIAPMAVVGLIAAAVWAYGLLSLNAERAPGHTKTVAVLQGALSKGFDTDSQYLQNAMSTYTTLALRAARNRPDVIVFPETAFPTNLSRPFWDDFLGLLSRQTGAELLVGGYDQDAETGRVSNSLFRYRDGVQDGVYKKVQLVPFGEFVPLRRWLSFLRNYGVRPDDVLPAQKHVLLNSRLGKLGVCICFESIFPQIARSETAGGAEVLCVVTNDSWFKRTQACGQHLMMAQLRAIENRRFLVRAAETGISAVIDPYGRTQGRLDLFRRDVMLGQVRPSSQTTIYTEWGDWFAYASIVLMMLGAVLSTRSPRVHSRAKPRRET